MRAIIDILKKVIQSLNGFLLKKSTPSMEAAFGIWKKSPQDGVEYQQAIRNEWEHS